MILSRSIATVEWALEVTPDNLSKIQFKDLEVDNPLYERLFSINGVLKVDYDGHFGPFISVTVDYSQDTEKIYVEVNNMVVQYLETMPSIQKDTSRV